MGDFMSCIKWLLLKLYKIRFSISRKVIIKTIKVMEGGEIYSTTLRYLYSKYHGIEIGLYSYGGCFNINNIPRGTVIGRYCSFARDVFIFNADHPKSFVTTHPFIYNVNLNVVKEEPIKRTQLSIGHDVWIGQNVIITSKVNSIGTGAIIGAGSVVTHNVPPYAIVAGVPAKVISYRFEKNVIENLLNSNWWENDVSYIRENKESLKNVCTFLGD
ncbi:CatB-related O-acetyltransferase [Caldibacillus thermoamylovorans]